MFSLFRKRKPDALFLTGAAARISQEIALIDGLKDSRRIKMKPQRLHLAGFSSGSLNILAINACFKPGTPLSWDRDYKENLIFPIRTEDIYRAQGPLPYSTDPLKHQLLDFLDAADFRFLGDYPLNSRILIFSARKMKTLWPSSTHPEEKHIPLLDLHMSSTAIPVVFPWQKIHMPPGSSYLPGGHFEDGGAGGIFKRFEEELPRMVAESGGYRHLYIISPMRFTEKQERDWLKEHLPIDIPLGGLTRMKSFLGDISQKVFVTFLQKLQEFNRRFPVADEIFVCIPRMEENFPLILFNYQREQYQAARARLREHPEELAVPLKDYLAGCDLED